MGTAAAAGNSYDLRLTIYDLRLTTGSKPTTYDLRLTTTTYDLRPTTYDLRLATYKATTATGGNLFGKTARCYLRVVFPKKCSTCDLRLTTCDLQSNSSSR